MRLPHVLRNQSLATQDSKIAADLEGEEVLSSLNSEVERSRLEARRWHYERTQQGASCSRSIHPGVSTGDSRSDIGTFRLKQKGTQNRVFLFRSLIAHFFPHPFSGFCAIGICVEFSLFFHNCLLLFITVIMQYTLVDVALLCAQELVLNSQQNQNQNQGNPSQRLALSSNADTPPQKRLLFGVEHKSGTSTVLWSHQEVSGGSLILYCDLS